RTSTQITTDQAVDIFAVEPTWVVRTTKSFRVQMLRDLRAGKLRGAQFPQASNQFWKIVQILEPLDPPSGLMFGDVSSDPGNAERQPITLFLRCHQHLLHDDSNDLLLVNRLSGRSVPQGRKVFRQL